MQIIELYVRGYQRRTGYQSGYNNANQLVDVQGNFTKTVTVGQIVFNVDTNESAKITAVDSDTIITLSDSIFSSGQNDPYLVISDFQRVDLFKDESVTITDTLMNLRDISKIYTAFSQQFTIPVSKNNSRLFRHYENQRVQNSFDVRFRQDALIKLNGISYKSGKIQFQSVSLKQNKAHSYKIIFYGDTVELKDVLGNALLENLDYGNLDFNYDSTEIINRLTGSYTSIIVPNIAHSKNMRLNNGNYKQLNNDGTTGENLIWTDLKPAISCKQIFNAITRTFPNLQFTGWINSLLFQRTYMWMHRQQGYVSNATEQGSNFILTNFLHLPDDSPGYVFQPSQSSPINYDPRPMSIPFSAEVVEYTVNVKVTTGTTENYTVRIRHKTAPVTFVEESYSQTGTTTTSFVFDAAQAYSVGYEMALAIDIEANNTISLTQQVEIEKLEADHPWEQTEIVWLAVFTPTSSTVDNEFVVARQVPKMKVIDFLSGIFKMFNLVAQKEADGKINIQLASVYLDSGNAYDITRYIDIESSSVERIAPFNKMEFKFKSKKSFLVQFADEINGIPFAEESFPVGIQDIPYDGTPYNIVLPFEKMMYERLNDETTEVQSDIGQGAMLDKKFEPTIGEPLIFFPIRQANTDSTFKIEDETSTLQTPTHYMRPSNRSVGNFYATGYSGKLQMNFGVEADEYTGGTVSTDSNLYSSGYSNFVEAMFNRQGRMLKVNAYLPQSILLKYNLNDKFIVNNISYRINSIKTNLLTNKSQLELYNKNEFISSVVNKASSIFERVPGATATKTKTTITVTYDKFSSVPNNFSDYDILLDGDTQSRRKQTDTNSFTISGLESGTYYIVTLRAVYSILTDKGTTDTAFSTDLNLEVTTEE